MPPMLQVSYLNTDDRPSALQIRFLEYFRSQRAPSIVPKEPRQRQQRHHERRNERL